MATTTTPTTTETTAGPKQRTLISLHALIDYVPLDKPPQFNQAQVSSNRFNSVFYMYDVNDLEVMEVCQLLSYFLRARFRVTFTRDPVTANETAAYNLFYSLKDFTSYYRALRTFVERVYAQNMELTEKFEEMADEAANGAAAGESAQIFQELRNLRKVFREFFVMFQSDGRLDPGVLYERLFLERSCSAVVPLQISLDTMDSLAAMFDQLCYFCVQSVDYCNTMLPAIVSSGIVMYTMLYFSGSGTDGAIDKIEAMPRTWGKVNSAGEGMPQWLHTQVESPAYRFDVSQLPTELFDAAAGDTYVRSQDFIMTLMVQTMNRLFTRLIEWPLREDVSSCISTHLQCDNIFRFFMEYGRNEQLWIRFRKRRQENRDLPSVYIKLDQLCGLYNEIALVTKKQPAAQQQQLPVEPTSSSHAMSAVSSMLNGGQQDGGGGLGHVALPPEKASVRERLDNLQNFKERYVRFWLNGVRQSQTNAKFQAMYFQLCSEFVLATGGFRGLDMASHAAEANHAFSLEPCGDDGGEVGLHMPATMNSLLYKGCAVCSDLLLPPNNREMFGIERWLELVHNLIFPYNLLSLTAPTLDEKTLNDAAVFKLLETFAIRRMTVDRANKLLKFFRENRAICQFVVTQSDIVALWTKATNVLAFIKDFLGIHEEATNNDE